MHDFSQLQQSGSGCVSAWLKKSETSSEKLKKQTPSSQGKLVSCTAVTFLDQGVFGRVARPGLTAIKDRQYASRGHACLTDELRSAFDTIGAVLDMRPQRPVRVLPQLGSRVLAASGAAQDACRIGSGGFLVVTPKKERLGAVVPVDDAVFHLWDEQETKIAQLELLMVLQGLLTFPSQFQGSSGVWYVDNIAALMALVRGRSDSPELDHMAQTVHILLFHLRCYLYFEWVPSCSNSSREMALRTDGGGPTGSKFTPAQFQFSFGDSLLQCALLFSASWHSQAPCRRWFPPKKWASS